MPRQALAVFVRQRESAFNLSHFATPAEDSPSIPLPILNVKTHKEGGELRGCIGHLRADTPLYRVVQEMAAAAATSDPRFSSLKAEELNQVKVEILILSPLRRITDPQTIEVGKHGLMIIKGGKQGALLPQVPIEQKWNRTEFLQGLCQKEVCQAIAGKRAQRCTYSQRQCSANRV
jgi:AmmeMemoRadiSam system protein A